MHLPTLSAFRSRSRSASSALCSSSLGGRISSEWLCVPRVDLQCIVSSARPSGRSRVRVRLVFSSLAFALASLSHSHSRNRSRSLILYSHGYTTPASMARDASRELSDSHSPPPSGSRPATNASAPAAPSTGSFGWGIPPALDPTEQFKYAAPPNRGAAPSGISGASGTGATDSRGHALGLSGRAVLQGGSKGGEAIGATPAGDEDDEDESQAQLEEDQRDEIILASSPALADRSKHSRNATQVATIKDIGQMKLGFGHGAASPGLSPRLRVHKYSAATQHAGASISSTVQALFTPAQSAAQSAPANSHESAQQPGLVTSSKPRPFAPVHNDSNRPPKRTSIDSVDKQSKRAKTSDGGTAKGQSGGASKALSTSASRKATSSSANGPSGRSSSGRSASTGGSGAGAAAQHKKKSEGSGPASMKDIVSELMDWQQEKEARVRSSAQLCRALLCRRSTLPPGRRIWSPPRSACRQSQRGRRSERGQAQAQERAR